jgi:hypothetical protein
LVGHLLGAQDRTVSEARDMACALDCDR